MADLWIFVGTLAIAYLVPGPDMVLVLETGLRHGRTPALATAAGLAAARAAHVALAALGLAALLRAAPWAFDAVRLAGAGYLVWLGAGMLRGTSDPAGSGGPESDGEAPGGGRTGRPSARTAVLRGLLTNLTNPKALLFCSILLPQFVRPDEGAVSGQFLALGAILVGTGAAFDALYACAGAGLGRGLARFPLVQAVQRRVFAALLIGFGVQLALA